MGGQGRVLFHLSAAAPVTTVQIKLTGGQVIGEVDGTELRGMAGIYFSVPRTPATYNFTIFAKDAAGCSAETTALRSFTVS